MDSHAGSALRKGLIEASWLLGLAVAVTVLFAVTPLDLVAARVFYRPDSLDLWPFARKMPWSALYNLAPWLTAILVILGLAALASGLIRRNGAWHRHGVFLLLCVAVGPGLIINTLFKDHWHRPRPRDVVELGGPLHYRIAPLPGGEGGASFPCGHCSVGFLYAAGWWVWRRRHPLWAWTSLAAGLLAGFALGLGRMAAGGHFLSDVVWSALLALSIAHILYYHVLRIPEHERRELESAVPHAPLSHGQRVMAIVAVLGGVGVLLALFAVPHGTPLTREIPLASFPQPPRSFQISARTANVEVVIVDAPADRISITGELHGFGLPTSRLDTHVEFDPGPSPALRYRIEQHGWFTDLDGAATVRVPAAGIERIAVHLNKGNIKVTDATREGVVRGGKVKLDLRTGAGRVQGARTGLSR